MSLENLSRRSFMKKTTILAVGVSSMTLFTGLVNAADIYHEKCDKVIFRTACRTDPSIYSVGMVCDVQCPPSNVVWQAWCRSDLSAGQEIGATTPFEVPKHGDIECQVVQTYTT